MVYNWLSARHFMVAVSQAIEHDSPLPEVYYDLTRDEVLPYVPLSASKVLDVGCSAGGFGSQIKARNPDAVVWGVEPVSEIAARAATRLDHVINGMFDASSPEFDGQRFDAICFNDVLEHIETPEQTLVDAKKLLSENGVVVASIPNILFLFQIARILISRDWKYEPSGIMDRTHLRFFTKKSIMRMFEESGYEIVKIEGFDPKFALKHHVAFFIANVLTLGHVKDWKYIQFAVQARPR